MQPRHLITLAGLLILAGCATLNEDECRTANWHDLGVRDGRAGEPASRIEAHRKACSDYGIHPREREYLDGRAEGLRDYCQLDNAFRSGLSGHSYQGVCPAAVDGLFRRYNEAAYEVYQSRKEIERIDGELTDKERRLRDKKLPDAERDRLRNDIRDLDRRLSRLRDDLRYKERDLDRLMEEARDRKRLFKP